VGFWGSGSKPNPPAIGGLGSDVSFPRSVQSGAPTTNAFWAYLQPRKNTYWY